MSLRPGKEGEIKQNVIDIPIHPPIRLIHPSIYRYIYPSTHSSIRASNYEVHTLVTTELLYWESSYV